MNLSVDGDFDGLSYAFANDNGDRIPSDIQAILNLWRSVIVTAKRDALGKVMWANDHNREVLKQQARNWLLKNKEQFTLVCELAGLNPESVRKRMRKVLMERHS